MSVRVILPDDWHAPQAAVDGVEVFLPAYAEALGEAESAAPLTMIRRNQALDEAHWLHRYQRSENGRITLMVTQNLEEGMEIAMFTLVRQAADNIASKGPESVDAFFEHIACGVIAATPGLETGDFARVEWTVREALSRFITGDAVVDTVEIEGSRIMIRIFAEEDGLLAVTVSPSGDIPDLHQGDEEAQDEGMPLADWLEALEQVLDNADLSVRQVDRARQIVGGTWTGGSYRLQGYERIVAIPVGFAEGRVIGAMAQLDCAALGAQGYDAQADALCILSACLMRALNPDVAIDTADAAAGLRRELDALMGDGDTQRREASVAGVAVLLENMVEVDMVWITVTGAL